MKKFLCLIGLLLFASLFNINTASSAPKKDIKKIIALIRSDRTKGIISRQSSRPMTEYNPEECKQHCFTEVSIVFIHKGVRYTIKSVDIYGDHKEVGVTVWARPNGTSSSKVLKLMEDDNADGTINLALFGSGGPDSEKVYRSKQYYGGAIGAKYRRYWQRQYDKAIAAAIKHFKLNTKQAQKPHKVPIRYYRGSL